MIPALIHNTKTGKTFEADAHQFEACAHLYANPRAALFLEMSLSKTVTVLSYLHDMHYAELAFNKTLVIAPDKVARITWPNEIEQWQHLNGLRYSVIEGDAEQRAAALEVDAELYIIGAQNVTWLIDRYIYQRVSKSGRAYGPWLGKLPFTELVIDELTLFKNRSSDRFKKLERALVLSDIDYRIGMTGTPAPNGYVDLWAQFKLLDDGARLGPQFGAFVDKYFTTRGDGMIVYEYKPKLNAIKVISHKIKDITLTMKTRDKIELPKLTIVDEDIRLGALEMEVYECLEREYTIDFFGGEVVVKTSSDLSNKLRQLTSGAIFADLEPGQKTKQWFELNTAKLDALGGLLAQYPDENFIVVYQFRHEIERIKARFPFAREFGKGKKLQADFDAWNRGDIRLLIIHPASAGHGLNLQFGGRRMVWFSVTWDLEHWLQTVARLLRRGALREIFIHRLIVKRTRDEKIAKRIGSKESTQDFLMNEITELRRKHGTKRK